MQSNHNMISIIQGTVISSMWFVLFFILSFSIFTTSVIYRLIASLLIKLQYPEAVFFGSMDTVLSLGKSVDENQLLYSLLCHGTVDIDYFKSVIMQNGVKRHPHMHSYVKEKYGYFFWLKEKNFNIDDHVLYHPNLNISTKDQWNQVQKNLYYNTPVPKGKAPWFFHFVPLNPDYEESNEEKCFYFVPVFYHCIADGYSVLYNFLKIISEHEEPKIFLTSVPIPTLFQEVLMTIQTVFLFPYFASEFFYKKPLFKEFARKGVQLYHDSGKVKTETIKLVKKSTRVPFFVVVLTCMMSSLEKFFRKSNLGMPREITVMIPQVLWKREDEIEFKNNFFPVYVVIPFSGKTGIDRMREIHEIINSSYTRCKYIVSYVAMRRVANIIPTFITRLFYQNDYNSVLLSIVGFEGFPNHIFGNQKIQSYPIKRMMVMFSNQGFVFQTITLGDDMSFSIHGKSSIATEEELEQMSKDFEEELQTLKQKIS